MPVNWIWIVLSSLKPENIVQQDITDRTKLQFSLTEQSGNKILSNPYRNCQ